MESRNFRPPFGFPRDFFDGFDGRNNRFEDEQDEYFGDDVFGRFRFGSFGPSSPFSDMHNAFRGAETMLRHVDKMFQDMQMYGEFGHILGPNDGHDTMAIDVGDRDDNITRRPGRVRSPRDEMLKVPDSDENTTPAPSRIEDREVQEDEMKQIINRTEDQGSGRHSPRNGFSWSGSSSMTTFSGFGSGKMEQRRTMQNADGSKSTIMARRMGDREVIITKTINRNGEEEVEEELVNMDENDRADFEQNWQYQRGPGSRIINNPRDQSITERDSPPLLDRHGPGILSKIFGGWFR